MEQDRREVVVVTGASAGVGRAVVREFARRKAAVGLIARGQDRLEAAKREVEEQGGSALAISLDLADSAAVQRAAEQVANTWGPIDVWVNNAMTTVFAPLKDIQPEEFKRATEVTYLGCVYDTMAALRQDVAPSFADWYLGTHGYEAQQTEELVAPDRPDNLFEPVAGDWAAHGIFTDQAKDFSLQNWVNLRRAPIALAAGIAGIGVFLLKRSAA